MQQWQRYLAELLGTFVLVFAGTTAIVGGLRSGIPPLLIAPFAFGLALLAGLYAFGEVSGGHYNPAVSIGMFLDRRINTSDFAGYLLLRDPHLKSEQGLAARRCLALFERDDAMRLLQAG